MCFAAPVIGLLSAGLSAAGSMASANAQAQQAEYNAAVARINRDTARLQGSSEADRLAQKYRGIEGQQVAAYGRDGRGGVLPTSGSAALVRGETGRNAWLDESTAIWNRETEAIGFDNKAKDLEAQAKAARQAGAIGAAGSFLTGLGRVGSGGGGAGSPLQITG
jgi:hypothetical protein